MFVVHKNAISCHEWGKCQPSFRRQLSTFTRINEYEKVLAKHFMHLPPHLNSTSCQKKVTTATKTASYNVSPPTADFLLFYCCWRVISDFFCFVVLFYFMSNIKFPQLLLKYLVSHAYVCRHVYVCVCLPFFLLVIYFTLFCIHSGAFCLFVHFNFFIFLLKYVKMCILPRTFQHAACIQCFIPLYVLQVLLALVLFLFSLCA